MEQEIEKIDPRLSHGLMIELSAKITPEQQAVKPGLVVIPKRWIVERTNAWINQCRVLWKNCEGLLSTSEAKIKLCAIRLLLRRLA